MKKVIFGFKPSEIDGSEYIFKENDKVELPDRYTYKPYLPCVIDQGSQSICVPCTISAFLNWRENLKDGKIRDNNISLHDIYNSRGNGGEGMTYKDAFKYLSTNGVKSKNGILKIHMYGKINNIIALKHAIVLNGPCFGALPVYSSDDDFWNEKIGDRLMGYHAISIVGYDEEGFFIRNSWGVDFGDNGYTHIKNSDMDKMLELWTIIE